MVLLKHLWLSLAISIHAQASSIPDGARRWMPRAKNAGFKSPGLITNSDEIHILCASNGSDSVAILDYGHSVEGIPEFEVVSTEGDTSVFEITYGESRAALDHYMVRSPPPWEKSDSNAII